MIALQRGAQPPASAVAQPQIRAALEQFEAAAAAAKAADREAVRLERTGRAQAEALDAEELARALEDKTARKPPPRHAVAYEKKLSDARRTAAASKLLEARRWQGVTEAFAQHGSELQAATEREAERRRRVYLEVLDSFQTALDAVAEMGSWRTFFADRDVMGAGMWRATSGASVAIMRPPPHSLADHLALVSDVVEELRLVGIERPKPVTNPAQARPDGGQTPFHRPLSQQGVSAAVVPAGGPAGG